MIRPLADPLIPEAGLAVLRGNLCPQGAVVKPSAATPELLTHTGPALVFDSIEDFQARIDDPELDVTADTVLVLRGCGPRGYPGMPEVGNMPLPAKLLAAGRRRHGAHQRRADERHRLRHRRCCTSHRSRPSADRWRSCARATSITLDVPARRLHARRRRRRARPSSRRRGGRRRRWPSAAGTGSTSTTSCRPTPVATSTSSSARAVRGSHARATESGPGRHVVRSNRFMLWKLSCCGRRAVNCVTSSLVPVTPPAAPSRPEGRNDPPRARHAPSPSRALPAGGRRAGAPGLPARVSAWAMCDRREVGDAERQANRLRSRSQSAKPRGWRESGIGRRDRWRCPCRSAGRRARRWSATS